jgi:hypothetical protein
MEFPQRRKRSFKTPLKIYLKRMISLQMDLEMALWQLLYLKVSQTRVYRNLYHHRQTKNHWARDDPAFHVLLAISLTSILC